MVKIVKRYIRTSAIAIVQNPRLFFPGILKYISDYRKLKDHLRRQHEFKIKPVYPFLHDNVSHPRTFSRYVFQGSWAFHHVNDVKPDMLVDIGSSRYFVAFAAQVCRVLYIDIRRISSDMTNVAYLCGDINHLPFSDGSVEAISSLSVLEHIGLGRYGDTVDAEGMKKAIIELKRVLIRDGLLLAAFPVGIDNVILFNAHRICTPEKVFEMFEGLTLLDERYALSDKMMSRKQYDAMNRPYAYGCYRFTK